MKFQGLCRNCNVINTFSENAKLSEILYCNEKCWKEHWIRCGVGLVHPKSHKTLLLFPKQYGGEASCIKLFNFLRPSPL